jgi:hypothetical protein
MGVVSAFIAAPQLELPASDFLSPISWLLGSLAPWLLGSLAPWLLGSLPPSSWSRNLKKAGLTLLSFSHEDR